MCCNSNTCLYSAELTRSAVSDMFIIDMLYTSIFQYFFEILKHLLQKLCKNIAYSFVVVAE